MSKVPTIIRAATSLSIEGGGKTASYEKGQFIDLRVDETGVPFVTFTETSPSSDMSGSSNSIITNVPSDGHVQTVDDPNPKSRIVIDDPMRLPEARDAISGVGISVEVCTREPNVLLVNKTSLDPALSALSSSGIVARNLTESKKDIKLETTHFAFTSMDVFESFLENTIFEEELSPHVALEDIRITDLLVKEKLDYRLLTSYMSESTNSLYKPTKEASVATVSVPVRRISTRMATSARMSKVTALKRKFNAVNPVMRVEKVIVDRLAHIENTQYYIQTSYLTSPRNFSETAHRVMSYLENEINTKFRILDISESALRLRLLDATKKEEIVSLFRSYNSVGGLSYALREDKSASDIFILSNKDISVRTESYYDGSEFVENLKKLEESARASVERVSEPA